MADMKFVKVELNEIFDVSRGYPKYTQNYANKNKGKYPVYSSKTEEDGLFAKINTYDYDGEYLTWSTDGYAGVLFYRNGKFSCTDHCGILKLKDINNNVYLPYVSKVLNLQSIAIGNGNMRVKTNMVKKANPMIAFPIKENGSYDYEEQIKIANNYLQLEEKRIVLLQQSDKLKSTLISADFASEYKHTEVYITELFSPENGDGSYTKKYCIDNLGNYPVYSGNTKSEFAKINKYDYDGTYLTWAKDGLAGYIMVLTGKFTITNHRGILIPTEKCKNVDMEYIKCVLEPIFRKNLKGRVGHDGENEYTTLNGTMIKQIKDKISIPINKDGTYDLNAQKEIAKKYKKINSVITSISNQIEELVNIGISL